MIKKIILLICITAPAFAQLEQTERYEVEVKRAEEGFRIIPADEKGLFLLQETSKYEKRNKQWNLIFLDSELKEIRNEQLLIDDKYKWIGYEYIAPHLYLLFRQGEMARSDLHVLKVNYTDGAVERFDIKNEIDFNITHFSVCKNSALMGGYVDNRPTLLMYNFKEAKVKAIPGFYLKDAQLIDITVNVNNTFNVLISNEKNQARKFLELKVYDANGELLADDNFNIPDGKDIFTGLTSRLENENLIVTGTFGSNNSKLAEGIYWAKADLSKEQELSLIPFTEFSSIYDYVSSDRRRERLQTKMEKKKESNRFFKKEHMYLHKVLEEDGNYYLLMELFDPVKYRSNPMVNPYGVTQRYEYPYSRFYSRLPYAYDVDEFSNIKYEQAIVAAVDASGNLLWDKALVFDNNKESSNLEQVSAITVKDKKLAIAYKYEDELHWKRIDVQDTSYVNKIDNIMLLKATDNLKNESDEEGGITYWYDGAFYVWGYHTFTRREEDSNERNYVFYINKLELQN